MSIFGEYESITENYRSLAFFTDRRHLIRKFMEYLHNDPIPQKILYFHGDGGNGKSLLLKYLQNHCTKRFINHEDWTFVQTLSNVEFVDSVVNAEHVAKIPYSIIDFSSQPREDYRPQEAFSALLKMKRDFSQSGLKFPLFNYACILYLYKTGRLTDEKAKQMFPAEEMDVVASLLELSKTVTDNFPFVSTIKSILGLASKRVQDKFTVFLHKRKVTSETVTNLNRLDAETELINELPKLFAQDLNKSLEMSNDLKRIVLFFDTHESFLGNQRNMSDAMTSERDEWLRCLLGNLELGNGIVVVIAGREIPRWSTATRFKIPDQYLDKQLVDHLDFGDALTLLQKVGITDEDLCNAILHYTMVNKDQYHPFYLGLCIDIVLQSQENGTTLDNEVFKSEAEDKMSELTKRLLRYVDMDLANAVRALSACRTFNEDIYFKLADKLRFAPSQANFDVLTQFSFVWQDPNTKQFTIHNLLKRVMYIQKESLTVKAHEVLEEYYKQRYNEGEDFSLIESIYHCNRVNPKKGIDWWKYDFDKAIDIGNIKIARPLNQLSNQLVDFDNEDIIVLSLFGKYHYLLNRFDDAKFYFQTAINKIELEPLQSNESFIYGRKGHLYRRLAMIHSDIGEYTISKENYLKAIEAYSIFLNKHPENHQIMDYKALAVGELGNLYEELSDLENAENKYKESIGIYNIIINSTAENQEYKYNQITSIKSLAKLYENKGNYDDAITLYNQGLQNYEELLKIDPDDTYYHFGLGNLYFNLYLIYKKLTQPEKSLGFLTKSQQEFEIVAEDWPDDFETIARLGDISYQMGIEYKDKSDYQQSIHFLNESIQTYESIIEMYDENLNTLFDLSGAYEQLAITNEELSLYEEAETNYLLSTKYIDKVIAIAPSKIGYILQKASVLNSVATMLISMGDYNKAEDYFSNAIFAYDHVLGISPNDLNGLNQKAALLLDYGNLKIDRFLYEEAIQTYNQAIELSDKILNKVDYNLSALLNISSAHLKIGDAFLTQNKLSEAEENYEAALNFIENALRKAPKSAECLNLKSNICHSFGHLNTKLNLGEQAEQNYIQSISIYSSILENSPQSTVYLNNKIGALLSYASILMGKLPSDKIISIYEEAISICETLNRISINNPENYSSLVKIHNKIARFYMKESSLDLSEEHICKALHRCEQIEAYFPEHSSVLEVKAMTLENLADIYFIREVQERASIFYDQSIALVNKILSKNPFNHIMYVTLGNCFASKAVISEEKDILMSEKYYKKAIEALTTATNLSPNADYFYDYARICRSYGAFLTGFNNRIGDSIKLHEKAIEEVEKGILLQKHDTELYKLKIDYLQVIGNLYGDLTSWSEAFKYLKDGYDLAQDVLNNDLLMGKEDLAIKSGILSYYMANSSYYFNEKNTTIKFYKEAINLLNEIKGTAFLGNEPEDLYNYLYFACGELAELYLKSNEDSHSEPLLIETIDNLELALSVSPDDHDLNNDKSHYLCLLSRIEGSKGEIEKAEQLLIEALDIINKVIENTEQEEDMCTYLDTKGNILFEYGEITRKKNPSNKNNRFYIEAIDEFLHVLSINPDDNNVKDKINKIRQITQME